MKKISFNTHLTFGVCILLVLKISIIHAEIQHYEATIIGTCGYASDCFKITSVGSINGRAEIWLGIQNSFFNVHPDWFDHSCIYYTANDYKVSFISSRAGGVDLHGNIEDFDVEYNGKNYFVSRLSIPEPWTVTLLGAGFLIILRKERTRR